MPQDETDSDRVTLVIFDCDGVLIDSEIVVCRLTSEELTRLGYPITTGEVIERYAGRPEHEMVADIEQDWGRAVPAEYFGRIRQRIGQAYSTELRAMPGAADLLGRIRIPVCVASMTSSRPTSSARRSWPMASRHRTCSSTPPARCARQFQTAW